MVEVAIKPPNPAAPRLGRTAGAGGARKGKTSAVFGKSRSRGALYAHRAETERERAFSSSRLLPHAKRLWNGFQHVLGKDFLLERSNYCFLRFFSLSVLLFLLF